MLKLNLALRVINFSKINLNSLFAELIETYQVVADEANIKIRFQENVSLEIQGDYQMLRQLFVNLLENVIQHAPNGTEVLVEISKNKFGKSQVFFVDNGPGVTTEFLEHIFEPFSRADTTRSRKVRA